MPESQLPTSCPRCLSRLVADRDIPCGWEDYGEMETGVSSLLEVHWVRTCQPGTAPAIREEQSQQEDEVTDHNYYAGCEVRCASGAGTSRLATSTGSRRHCSRSRRRRLTTRSAAGVTHALPLRSGFDFAQPSGRDRCLGRQTSHPGTPRLGASPGPGNPRWLNTASS